MDVSHSTSSNGDTSGMGGSGTSQDHRGQRPRTGHHDVTWAMTAQATMHCLTGCAIGEVLGMVIGTGLRLHNAGTVLLSIALAFVFGYLLTMRACCGRGFPRRGPSRSR